MQFTVFLKTQLNRLIDEVKSTLPDDREFDFRKHLLPIFLPFLSWKDELRDRETLQADLTAGFLGAILVIPQGIAFAMIAGLPPQYGLYTAMVVPIVAALFGSSRHLVSGPTTAISLVIFSSVSQFAAEGSPEYLKTVLLLTFTAGAIQLGLGLGRLGRYISFVSHTVVVGFTAGAAVLIVTNSMKGVLGLQIPSRASFIDTWAEILSSLHEVSPPIFSTAAYTLAAALVFRAHFPKIPHLLAGLIFGTAFAWSVGGDEIGIPMVAEVPRQLPSLSSPGISASAFQAILGDAFAIAILGLVEAVAIARSISTKTGHSINGNQEFIGQGLSNLVGSFFSCFAGSGSFTRSGLNYAAGARTPMAAVFAALILMVMVLLFAPLTKYLPSPALSGLILLIGWNLIDVHQLRDIFRGMRSDQLILGAVFFTTLFGELEFAIYLGVLLSLYFFLRRTSTPNIATMLPDYKDAEHPFVNLARREDLQECPQLKIIRIDGHLYFAAIDHVAASLREIRKEPVRHLIIFMNGVNYIDLDGAEWLVREAKFWQQRGGGLYIVRLKVVAQKVMEAGGFMDEIGRENFFSSKTDAIFEVYRKLNRQICKTCPRRVFFECKKDGRLPKLTEK